MLSFGDRAFEYSRECNDGHTRLYLCCEVLELLLWKYSFPKDIDIDKYISCVITKSYEGNFSSKLTTFFHPTVCAISRLFRKEQPI